MKAELEHLQISTSNHSFKFFKSNVDAFTPYWHYHPELELTFIVKGEGTRFVGDSIASFNNYDLVLVGKNTPHHWVSHEQFYTKKQLAYVFQFEASIFEEFKECSHLKHFFHSGKRGIQFNEPNDTIVNLIMNFEHQNAIQQLGSLMSLLDILSKFENKSFLTSDTYNSTYGNKPIIQKFATVNNYILEHLDHKLTVSQMANFTHMVPQSFCRWFKKHSGHSFINFLNQVRIQRACQYLLTSNEPIQDISFQCGFETLSHFNRTFKKLKKCSPRDFRKRKKLSQN